MELDETTARALRETLGALEQGDALCRAAVPSLSRLQARGQAFEIDLAASKVVGAPVVVAHARPPAFDALTPRQRQVAQALAAGRSNKEIAAELGISVATAKDHVHAVLSRLGLKRRGEVGALFRSGTV